MPRRPARKARKARPRKRVVRKKRSGGMTMATTAQHATISETIEFQEVNPNTALNANFSLNQFYRASTLAYNFKYYRAKSVTWEYAPLFNTFQEGTTAGQATKPYLYTVMNRTQDYSWLVSILPLFTIQSQGAKPQTLTNKKVIKYRPNWTLAGPPVFTSSVAGPLLSAVVQGNTPSYGWLSCPVNDTYGNNGVNLLVTNPYLSVLGPITAVASGAVMYNGHNYYLEQDGSNLLSVCKLTCTVVWEFKQPNLYLAPTRATKAVANSQVPTEPNPVDPPVV